MSVIIADLAKCSKSWKGSQLTVVVYKLLRPNGGLCILNEYSVNFVAGEHNMDTMYIIFCP